MHCLNERLYFNVILACLAKRQLVKIFLLISDTLKKLTENNVHYQCEYCGFSGKKLHWLCPRCRRWETMQYLME